MSKNTKQTFNKAENSNKSKPLSADVIINRLEKIKGFETISTDNIKKICDAFINGFFVNNIGSITYIVQKKQIINLYKFTDSDICFWSSRIIGTPLVTIIT